MNYSVKKSVLKINEEHTLIKLKLSVDTKYGSVMDYFEDLHGPDAPLSKGSGEAGPAVQADD